LGHLARKNRPQYDLQCVWWDVKPYSTLLHDGTKTAATTITKLATGIVLHESLLPI